MRAEKHKVEFSIKVGGQTEDLGRGEITLVCGWYWRGGDDTAALIDKGAEQGLWRETHYCSCIFS